jgi:two-component system nitrogen regulation response regulator NtrX
MKETLLVIDDDKSIFTAIKLVLNKESFQIDSAQTIKEGLQMIKNNPPQLVLLDVHFPGGSGLDLLTQLKNENLELPVLMISGAASAAEAVKGIKLGAYDYLEKPITADRLKISIRRCLDYYRKTEILNGLTQPYSNGPMLIGNSDAMMQVKKQVQKIAHEDIRVLITGETGTGKEVIAQNIWKSSRRADQSFILVNSAAIPDSLIESELFGHKKGAFTDAHVDRAGKIEMADKGTLFLDEIGDLSLPAQAKLLRFLENHEVQRVGDPRTKKVDVRVLTATSKNLEEQVRFGKFRADLYYRINVARIHLPALQNRREDIPDLFRYFLSLQKSFQKIELDGEALNLLTQLPWQGNVRELKNFTEMLPLTFQGLITKIQIEKLLQTRPEINPAQQILNHYESQPENEWLSLKNYKNKMEKAYIEKVLTSVGGSVSKAARILEIDRSYLHQKMTHLNCI